MKKVQNLSRSFLRCGGPCQPAATAASLNICALLSAHVPSCEFELQRIATSLCRLANQEQASTLRRLLPRRPLMKRMGIALAALLALALVSFPALAWIRSPATTFGTLPAGATPPEGLTTGPNGDVYASTFGFPASGPTAL